MTASKRAAQIAEKYNRLERNRARLRELAAVREERMAALRTLEFMEEEIAALWRLVSRRAADGR
jgi:hypothetical protein